MANEKGVKKSASTRLLCESLIHENLFAKWKGALLLVEKAKRKMGPHIFS